MMTIISEVVIGSGALPSEFPKITTLEEEEAEKERL